MIRDFTSEHDFKFAHENMKKRTEKLTENLLRNKITEGNEWQSSAEKSTD